MPIKWTSELDAILLHGVFEECNISFNKSLCTKIAERVSAAGMECTAKAVENRLYSWKKKNVSGQTNLNSATNTPSKSSAANTPKSTPRARAKSTPRKKKQVSEEVDSDGPSGLVDDDEVLSPTAARGKRCLNGKVKPKYAEASDNEDGSVDVEEEYVPLAKRVKAEPVEDDEVLGDELVDEEV
ncbi:hypothetical protein GT037_009107 [Alternaria burnsii]|uniref:Uncharacterized protein n=1 Tax=Alternaria burnsii TaxID=1187904 RepID=A0A8H7AVY5_9PLEO|nr:uncharacterized protein GT037_009107 [Alternaria burnsii]KAF7672606.1 hypothetical protein GT037_009107 [Alternaria burnsii]